MDVFLNALLLNSVGVLRFTVLCEMKEKKHSGAYEMISANDDNKNKHQG